MRWYPAAATDFGEGAQQLGIQVIVKNTFFDVEEREEEPMCSKRSSSVPRKLKFSSPTSRGSPAFSSSTISTAASDGELSDDGIARLVAWSGGLADSPAELARTNSVPLGPFNPRSLKSVFNPAAPEFVPSSPGGGDRSPAASPQEEAPCAPADRMPCMPPFPAPTAADFPSPPASQCGARAAPCGAAEPSTPELRIPSRLQHGGPTNEPQCQGALQAPWQAGAVRLNPRAEVFQPFVASPPAARAPPSPSAAGEPPGGRAAAPLPVHAEIKSVIGRVYMELSRHPPVKQVTVAEGRMGTMTTVHVEMRDGFASGKSSARVATQLAKDVFLRSAERSAGTYVMGYNADPFRDEEDGGFQVTLSSVPQAMQQLVCWETFQRGCCASRAHCDLCHPSDNDLAPVRLSFVRKEDTADCTAATVKVSDQIRPPEDVNSRAVRK